MNRLRLLFPYLMLIAIVGVVVAANLSDGDSDRAPSAKSMDVVCNMEVNPSWDIRCDHNGETYYFCNARCREAFLANPTHFLTEKCLVCEAPLTDRAAYPATYLGKTYSLCSEAHRAEFKRDPAALFMHTMWGIPGWLYYASIAVVLIVSFGVFDWMGRRLARSSAHAADDSPQSIGRDTNSIKRVWHGFPTRVRTGRRPVPLSAGVVTQHADTVGGAGRSEPRVAGSGPGYEKATSIALPILSPSFVGAASSPSRSLRRPGSVAAQAEACGSGMDSAGGAGCGGCGDRFDLLSVGWIRACFRSRLFRFTLQLFVSVLFVLIIAAGLIGNQNPALNIAPILTWTVWWGLLIVLILFAGKAWCYVCPWDAIAGWTERLSFWKKSDDGLTLGRKWPRVVRNISIATIMFVGLTWIELGFGVTMKPRVTAYLAIAMLLMAVVSALLFDRKSFCRYGCLVGRVSGLYALFASTEVRAKSASVCKRCHTVECVKGSESAYGCPTFLHPGKLETNTYCIQCMECVQACPHDNLAVNLRPWGSDLALEGKPRSDEAYLALLMLAITGFHGLTMTPAWQQLIDAICGSAGVGRVIGFSLGMALLMFAPIGIYAALVGVSKWLGDSRAPRPLTYRDYFIRYAYALLPIALFYHIAHNAEHLLMEGPKVAALISDPFGWGWNVFGTAQWTIPPLISLDKLWIIQVLLVLVGHVYSLWVAQRTSLRLFGSARAATRSQLPMLVGMIAFSVFSLWLLKQPMEMRTSAM